MNNNNLQQLVHMKRPGFLWRGRRGMYDIYECLKCGLHLQNDRLGHHFHGEKPKGRHRPRNGIKKRQRVEKKIGPAQTQGQASSTATMTLAELLILEKALLKKLDEYKAIESVSLLPCIELKTLATRKEHEIPYKKRKRTPCNSV